MVHRDVRRRARRLPRQPLSSDRITPLEARLAPDKQALLGETFELLRGWMVFHDPPHHERSAARPDARSPPRWWRAAAFAQTVVDECIDRMRGAARSARRSTSSRSSRSRCRRS
jgi:hypothetical protein